MFVINGFDEKLMDGDSCKKQASGKLSENVINETKKCLHCMRRVDIDYVRCPYCRSGRFQFNDS